MRRSVTALVFAWWSLACTSNVVLLPFGGTWRHLDNGSDQGTGWRASAFVDTTWAPAMAELGYGDGDETTVVSFGANASSKYVTTYFRAIVDVVDPGQFSSFLLRYRRDDGMVIYVNGQEVLRSNMPTGTIAYNTLASTSVSGAGESAINSHTLPTSWFIAGTNVIAVEIHQVTTNSSDITFDLQLTGVNGGPTLTRGPCLHIATPTGILLKWRTDAASNARVRYGTTWTALTNVVDVAAATLDHEVTLSGLQPATTYYYSIGTTTTILEGGDPDHFFRTSPTAGAQLPLRIWVTGDAGTSNADQRRVRTAYLNTMRPNTAQTWFWLGDNAYQSGTESEFQTAVFENMYEPVLRNTTLWPAPGNHDYDSGASAATNTGPYFDLFAMPKNGEAGGLASNTEAYYSYDVGNVHFVSLDSDDTPRGATSPMATWLAADLVQARAYAEWIIAYWHHPPYTKGNHSSDDFSDPRSGDMRQNIGPILEANGVDLVLCGHSHTYERSYLINGHYGVSSTFNSGTMGVNMTSGRADGPGAYQKPGDLVANAGTVYAVCGVSGKKEGGAPLNHPVMYMSTVSHLGSMVIDVNGTALSARFVNDAGLVIDHFDIAKTSSHVKLALKVLLDGPCDPISGLMSDSLRATGVIPLTQPYSSLFTHVGEGGNETIAPSVLSVTGNNAIVDWVFVELRDRSDPSIVLDTRATLVQRDGDVVDLDGISPLSLTMPVGNYHVAVRHRDHLGAMTAAPVTLNRIPLTVDLSSPATMAWGTSARREENGRMLLWCGDAVRDGQVKYTGANSDRDMILTRIGGVIPTNAANGYLGEDVNMDGTVKYTGAGNDRDRVLQTIGGLIPTNVIFEQLP